MNKVTAPFYIPLVKALADGKTIQTSLYPEQDDSWRDSSHPIFCYPPENYRIKPETTMVPLESNDIPPDSVVRIGNVGWYTIQHVGHNCISIPCLGRHYSFKDLMRDNWEIKRPGEDWKPCYKTVNNE